MLQYLQALSRSWNPWVSGEGRQLCYIRHVGACGISINIELFHFLLVSSACLRLLTCGSSFALPGWKALDDDQSGELSEVLLRGCQ